MTDGPRALVGSEQAEDERVLAGVPRVETEVLGAGAAQATGERGGTIKDTLGCTEDLSWRTSETMTHSPSVQGSGKEGTGGQEPTLSGVSVRHRCLDDRRLAKAGAQGSELPEAGYCCQVRVQPLREGEVSVTVQGRESSDRGTHPPGDSPEVPLGPEHLGVPPFGLRLSGDLSRRPSTLLLCPLRSTRRGSLSPSERGCKDVSRAGGFPRVQDGWESREWSGLSKDVRRADSSTRFYPGVKSDPLRPRT